MQLGYFNYGYVSQNQDAQGVNLFIFLNWPFPPFSFSFKLDFKIVEQIRTISGPTNIYFCTIS